MNILKVISMTLLLLANTAVAEEASTRRFESSWVSQSELDAEFRRASDNRLMMYKVEGKMDSDGLISYKGYFIPYPPDLDYFYSYWGMNNRWYIARKKSLENAGFKEVWHQSFRDLSNEEVHQAVWLRIAPPSEEKRDDSKSKGKTYGPAQKSIAM